MPIRSKTIDERALAGRELGPGHERHDDEQRADVEDEDPPDDGVDGACGSDFAGVLGLACGDADQLDALEGEHHDLQRQDDAQDARREEAAVAAQRLEKLAASGRCSPDPKIRMTTSPMTSRRDDRHHLDQREPELELAEDTSPR